MGEFFPILVLLVLAMIFAVASLAVGSLMGPRHPNPSKLAAYESGNEPLARVKGHRFPVKFYLVALSFLVFDVEVVFLFPWATLVEPLGWFGLGAIGIFIAILLIGLVYEFRAGGLEWD